MANIEPRIRAMLAGTPHAVQKIGPLWQIRVGTHAGARSEGVSLARELLAKYRREHPQKEAAPVETVREVPGPERVVYRDREDMPDQDRAKLEAAVERLREAAEKMATPKPKRGPNDMFDLSDLQDLIRENEPHAESQERFRLDYVQLTSRLVDPRVTPLSDEERRYQSRLQVALYAGRGGAVEII